MEEKTITGISKLELLNKYSTYILLVCLVVGPIMFCCKIVRIIPEATYTINGILEVNGDDNDYSVAMKVRYYIDVDMDDREETNHDYLFDGPESTKTEVNEVFSLLDVTPPAQICALGFESEYFECLPDTIQSNKTYAVELWGSWIDGYDDFGNPTRASGYERGQLSIPPLTKENLGITIEEQLRSISVLDYVGYVVFFISAAVSLLLLKKDNYWKT